VVYGCVIGLIEEIVMSRYRDAGREFNRGVLMFIVMGRQAAKDAINPYSPKSNPKRFHAWSAGHFDKWGRV